MENEYDHVREAFDEGAVRYINWAANMAIGLKTGVPWIMCKQRDAPGEVVIYRSNFNHTEIVFTR